MKYYSTILEDLAEEIYQNDVEKIKLYRILHDPSFKFPSKENNYVFCNGYDIGNGTVECKHPFVRVDYKNGLTVYGPNSIEKDPNWKNYPEPLKKLKMAQAEQEEKKMMIYHDIEFKYIRPIMKLGRKLDNKEQLFHDNYEESTTYCRVCEKIISDDFKNKPKAQPNENI